MSLTLLGVGTAGTSIVEGLIVADGEADTRLVEATTCFDTSESDLDSADIVPEQYRVLVGVDRVKGHGTGASPELGADVFNEDISTVQRALNKLPVTDTAVCVVVAALGGGTGGGGAPVLSQRLGEVYPSQPVLGVGVLPADDEGTIYSENAEASMEPFVNSVDTAILLENHAVRWAENRQYPEVHDIREAVKETAALYR